MPGDAMATDDEPRTSDARSTLVFMTDVLVAFESR
jgi:hypothetical protein